MASETPRKKTSALRRIEERIEEESGRVLTPRQKTFAELYIQGTMTNGECARRAGYSPDTAVVYASKLLDGRTFPHVVEYVNELREERERRFGVTLMGQLERLHQLSRGAEEANQYSAAINAEKLRSALGGLTIDRRETINTLDQLSREEITARLMDLQRKFPTAFTIEGTAKDVTNGKRSRGQLLEHSED